MLEDFKVGDQDAAKSIELPIEIAKDIHKLYAKIEELYNLNLKLSKERNWLYGTLLMLIGNDEIAIEIPYSINRILFLETISKDDSSVTIKLYSKESENA